MRATVDDVERGDGKGNLLIAGKLSKVAVEGHVLGGSGSLGDTLKIMRTI